MLPPNYIDEWFATLLFLRKVGDGKHVNRIAHGGNTNNRFVNDSLLRKNILLKLYF